METMKIAAILTPLLVLFWFLLLCCCTWCHFRKKSSLDDDDMDTTSSAGIANTSSVIINNNNPKVEAKILDQKVKSLAEVESAPRLKYIRPESFSNRKSSLLTSYLDMETPLGPSRICTADSEKTGGSFMSGVGMTRPFPSRYYTHANSQTASGTSHSQPDSRSSTNTGGRRPSDEDHHPAGVGNGGGAVATAGKELAVTPDRQTPVESLEWIRNDMASVAD